MSMSFIIACESGKRKIAELLLANKEVDVTYTDEKGRTTTKVITKQVIPDTTAQIFWLKNRKPNEWREKREVEINNEQQSSAMNQLIQSLNQARGDK